MENKTWQTIKQERLKLDNSMCTVCSSNENLVCHHLTYKNLNNEKINELLTICKSCHSKIHRKIPTIWDSKNIQIKIKSLRKGCGKKELGYIKFNQLIYEKLNRPTYVEIYLLSNYKKLLILKTQNKNGLKIKKKRNSTFVTYFITSNKFKCFIPKEYVWNELNFLKGGFSIPILFK